MPTPGGYAVDPGLYRVPDLLTEEQFVRYMKDTYNRDIQFVDDVQVTPARALGQSFNIAPALDVDADADAQDVRNLMSAHDPVLQRHNEYDFGSAYGEQAAEKAREEEEESQSSSEPSSKTATSKTSTSTKK
jgi:hypothetical protein